MKNIGIICYPTFGGSGIVATELGKQLSNKYFIHFISYKKPVRFDDTNKNIKYHKVDVPNYPLFEYPPYELALTAKIVQIVQEFNLDLLHVHYAIPHAYAAVNAKKILMEKDIHIPIVTTLHGTDITLVVTNPHLMSAVNYAINKSDIVTTVSEDLKMKTLDFFNVNHEIQVIPNFISCQKIEHNFNIETKKRIIHISNFRPVKRAHDVVKVFQGILSEIDSELIMIGDGPDLNSVISLTQKLNLQDSVRFLGKSKDIDGFLKYSDLFLLPSETESFGLVALEAMSFGVPVISSNMGGVTELVIHGFNGYNCMVGDVNMMISKSLELLRDANLFTAMSKNAYATAKKYDIIKIVSRYEQLYLNLL